MADSVDSNSESSQVVSMVLRKKLATTPISLLVESLVKNLCAMIESDEKRAMKIYNVVCSKLHEMKLIDESYRMTEFEGMRGQYERALYTLVKAARGGEEIPKSVEQIWLSEELKHDWSHYYREFEEQQFIAGGGFGQVFQVRHKLDGSEYAVKKIYIHSNEIKSVMKYITEVKTLASLNHPNIVQYKAAWLELGVVTCKKALKPPRNCLNSDSQLSHEKSMFNDDTESDDDNFKHKKFEKKNVQSGVQPTERSHKKSSSNFTVEFEYSKKYSYSNENMSPKRSQESRTSISEGGQAMCKVSTENLMEDLTNPQQNWATLYIQMALCQITLKNWLENRNFTPETPHTNSLVHLNMIRRDTVLEILRQLCKGLQYIHSKRIVHHDIKPSNIFLQMNDIDICVQLGDFGLACPLQDNKHCIAMGTKLYAAPEQLEGKCNSKSDMYSLGIVLLELISSFRTDMERIRNISELRKGHLPSYITAHEPQIAQTISLLISKHPNHRPTAGDLLDKLTTQTDDRKLVNELRVQLAEKEKEINRLRGLLEKAGVKE